MSMQNVKLGVTKECSRIGYQQWKLRDPEDIGVEEMNMTRFVFFVVSTLLS
jgi:hypothetical protein